MSSRYERDILYGFRGLQISPENDDLRGILDAVVAIYRQWEHDHRQNTIYQPFTLGYTGSSYDMVRDECRNRMLLMKEIYQEMGRRITRVDFSDVCTQWAYMFVYMLRHVHLVFYALDFTVREKATNVNPTGGPSNVCMIGGGPGSDILGLIMFLCKHGCSATASTGECTVLDWYPAWKQSWENLHRHLPDKYRQATSRVAYYEFDYHNNTLPPHLQGVVNRADIVTMIKSLSPAAAKLKEKKPLRHWNGISADGRPLRGTISLWHSVYSILEHMKVGACLIYMDNKTGPQRRVLMEAAGCLEFNVVFDRVLRVSLPTAIFSSHVHNLIRELNYNPCSTAVVSITSQLQKLAKFGVESLEGRTSYHDVQTPGFETEYGRSNN